MSRPGVRVTITGDSQGLERALSRSSGALSGFGQTALGVFGGNVLTKGLDLAVDGLRNLATFATDGIGRLDDLGDNLALLEARSKGLGDAVDRVDLSRWGVDRGEAAAAADAIAAMAQGTGIAGDELRTVVPRMTELAAQLSALGKGEPDVVARNLAAALKGSTRQAAALGVELPKGAKGLEAYEAIMAQLGPTVAEAASGTASLADVSGRWDAVMANLQLELAGFLESLAPLASQLIDLLVPAMRDLAQTVGPALAAIMTRLGETFGGFVSGGGPSKVAGILGKIAEVAGKLGGFLLERVLPVVVDLGGAILEALAPAVDAASDAFAAWWPVLEQLWGFVEDVVVPLLRTYVLPLLGKLLEIGAKLAGALGTVLANALRTVADWFRRVLDWAKPLIDALGTIARIGGDVVGGIAGAIGLRSVQDGPPVPYAGAGLGRSAGGYGSSSPGRAAVVNVYAGVGDPVAIGREVARVLGAYGSRGGHA